MSITPPHRRDPLYQQLVQHFRDRIQGGEIAEGVHLPNVRALAEELGVSRTTISKALQQLAAEGLVRTGPRGTAVSWSETNAYTPRDRLRSIGRAGRIYPVGDHAVIVAASVISAPAPIAAAMLIRLGTAVIRRERVTFHGDVPITRSTSWMPGDLLEAVPELATRERIHGGTVGLIAERTGRTVVRDTYREQARRADATDAVRLGVDEGDPVLFGENTWYEADGVVLEFGQSVIPEGRWVVVAD